MSPWSQGFVMLGFLVQMMILLPGCGGYVGKAMVMTDHYRLVEVIAEERGTIREGDDCPRIVNLRTVTWDVEQQYLEYRCRLAYRLGDDLSEYVYLLLLSIDYFPDPTSATAWESHFFSHSSDYLPGKKNKLYYEAPSMITRFPMVIFYPLMPSCTIGTATMPPPIRASAGRTLWKSVNRRRETTREVPMSFIDVYAMEGDSPVLLGRSDALGRCPFLPQTRSPGALGFPGSDGKIRPLKEETTTKEKEASP